MNSNIDCNYFSGDSRGPQIKMKLNSGWILEQMEDWWRSRAEYLRKGEGNEPCVEDDLEFDTDIVFNRITQRVSDWFDCDKIFRGRSVRLFNSNAVEHFWEAIREEFDKLEDDGVITQILSSDDDSDEEEDRQCDSCGTTCLDHTSNKGRGSESPCQVCMEHRCKMCPCECEYESDSSD